MRQIDSYEGLTGRINVRSDGELERDFSVVQMAAGNIKEVQKLETPNFVVHGQADLGTVLQAAGIVNNTASVSNSKVTSVR